MKNFVKYTLAIAICAAALLSSCIKEPEYIRTTAELSVSLTGVEGTRSVTQGNLIKDAWILAYQCTLDDTGAPTILDEVKPSGARYVSGLNSYNNLSVHVPLPTCSEVDGTPIPQSYLLVAVINTEAFGTLNINANSTWGTVKDATFAMTDTLKNSYPKDNEPQVMPISNWTTLTITNADTHSDNCYKLNLPVYRAVAKTQLYMSKAGEFDLKVLDAKVVANGEYSNGMLLTGNANRYQFDADGNPTTTQLKGDNDEAIQQGLPSEDAATWWWNASPTAKTADKGYQLKNGTSGFAETTITAKGNATNPQNGSFDWVASTFLLENNNDAPYGTGAYNTPQGDGYNLYVKYQVGTGAPVEVYTPLGKVVRNSDYKVYATVNSGGELTFTIEVNQWVVEEEEINYQDIATLSENGHIMWLGSTLNDGAIDITLKESYKPLPNGETINDLGQVTATASILGEERAGVINLTAAQNASATFKFALETPVGGTWIAELRTIGNGDTGDIVFGSVNGTNLWNGTTFNSSVTAEGGPLVTATPTYIEGNIDNQPNVITIKNLVYNSATASDPVNIVELHIYAKAYWGTVLRSYRVDGIVGSGVNYKVYTLWQPQGV